MLCAPLPCEACVVPPAVTTCTLVHMLRADYTTSTTLHYTTLHYTTLHHITLTALHCTTHLVAPHSTTPTQHYTPTQQVRLRQFAANAALIIPASVCSGLLLATTPLSSRTDGVRSSLRIGHDFHQQLNIHVTEELVHYIHYTYCMQDTKDTND